MRTLMMRFGGATAETEIRKLREALIDARDYLRVGHEDAALRTIERALNQPDDD